MQHQPVLLEEVLHHLHPKPGGVYLDATIGAGGHAEAILDKLGESGRLYGFDRDARNLAIAKERLQGYGERAVFVCDSFAHIGEHDLPPLDGALFDLGFSSMHVDEAERGFSFMHDGPLDMRYDQSGALTAEVIVNEWTRDEIADLIFTYGEETMSRQIAEAIQKARKKVRITTTTQLAEIVSEVVKRRGKAHPATKTFQALRIAVNDEFGQIAPGLSAVTERLKEGGVLAVITFHSLEDRLVKQWMKGQGNLTMNPRKVIKPTWQEQKTNRRARSAKLRIAIKGGYENPKQHLE